MTSDVSPFDPTAYLQPVTMPVATRHSRYEAIGQFGKYASRLLTAHQMKEAEGYLRKVPDFRGRAARGWVAGAAYVAENPLH